MPRNIFISYDFERDLAYKEKLSASLKALGHSNYSLSIQERGDDDIWDEIYRRSWTCSVIVVLVGAEAASSTWINREIDQCLLFDDSLQAENPRRIRKPKGVLAIQLPGGPHPVPKLVDKRLQAGSAVSVTWRTLSVGGAAGDAKLDGYVELAAKRR